MRLSVPFYRRLPLIKPSRILSHHYFNPTTGPKKYPFNSMFFILPGLATGTLFGYYCLSDIMEYNSCDKCKCGFYVMTAFQTTVIAGIGYFVGFFWPVTVSALLYVWLSSKSKKTIDD